MSTPSFFYSRDGHRYAATSATAGPWDEKLQHGGPVAALLGSRIEREAAREGARVAHFSLEFLGPIPIASLEVTTKVVRPGKKIALWSSSARDAAGQIVPRKLRDVLGDKDPAKAGRAMEAMMAMKKFDIAALERAHAGS